MNPKIVTLAMSGSLDLSFSLPSMCCLTFPLYNPNSAADGRRRILHFYNILNRTTRHKKGGGDSKEQLVNSICSITWFFASKSTPPSPIPLTILNDQKQSGEKKKASNKSQLLNSGGISLLVAPFPQAHKPLNGSRKRLRTNCLTTYKSYYTSPEHGHYHLDRDALLLLPQQKYVYF